MSLYFEYGGKLTQSTGEIKITLPVALLEGCVLTLLEADGTENELPFTVEQEELSFALDFASADEDETPVPIRAIHLLPVAK